MSEGNTVKRSVRVAERIRLELSELLLRGEIRDPRVSGAIVSRVEVTNDLSLARVYVRLLVTESTAREQRALVKALTGARGFLRREISSRLTSKKTPDLKFYWDEGVERAARVEGILAELRADGELDPVAPLVPTSREPSEEDDG